MLKRILINNHAPRHGSDASQPEAKMASKEEPLSKEEVSPVKTVSFTEQKSEWERLDSPTSSPRTLQYSGSSGDVTEEIVDQQVLFSNMLDKKVYREIMSEDKQVSFHLLFTTSTT